ncbi:hypothetical protein N9937_01150 [bacterium]|nr:hypothetical protein [bacterium]
MANYPTYDILLTSSKVEEEDGIVDDYAQSGVQHSRIFYSQDYYLFSIDHALTLAEFNSLKATYDAGKRDVYTLTYYDESPIATYSVKFTRPPQITGNNGVSYYVTSTLRGTKD